MSTIDQGVYLRPDGSYVYVREVKKPISVSYRDKEGNDSTCTYKEAAKTWVHQPLFRDVPDAVDPRLPYSFDLHWDVHTLSELHADGVTDAEREHALQYGIDLDDPDTVRAYNFRRAEWLSANYFEDILPALQAAFPAADWVEDSSYRRCYSKALNVGVDWNDELLVYNVYACGGVLADITVSTLPAVIDALRTVGPLVLARAEAVASAFAGTQKEI